jgi:hypothetical protein
VAAAVGLCVRWPASGRHSVPSHWPQPSSLGTLGPSLWAGVSMLWTLDAAGPVAAIEQLIDGRDIEPCDYPAVCKLGGHRSGGRLLAFRIRK